MDQARKKFKKRKITPAQEIRSLKQDLKLKKDELYEVTYKLSKKEKELDDLRRELRVLKNRYCSDNSSYRYSKRK